MAQITVADSGENQIVIVAGANAHLDESDVKISRELISGADVVICQLETSAEVASAAIDLCKGVSIWNFAQLCMLTLSFNTDFE